VYSDAAMSGARCDRPGYRALLAEASRYNVVLVDDLSRLSRDTAECATTVKRLTFARVRLIGVSDGVDTARDSHKVDVGLRSLMSELFLEDLGKKTHRGLTGRAMAGASAGGLPYGYRVPRVDGVAVVGQREIDPEQAEVVRRIYTDYLAGQNAREIAGALNREGVPSARGSTWCMSAIFGDIRRGIGILANPIYVGRMIWNRSHWVKHPDSGRRVRQERPREEWIDVEHPELAIVSQDVWDAVQARIRGRRTPTAPPAEVRRGRPPKHLLSGILRCPTCGGPIVGVDGYRYGCSTNKDRGDAVCSFGFRVRRTAAEEAVIGCVQELLLNEASWKRAQAAIREAFRTSAPDMDAAKARIAAAEKAHGNIMKALRAGIITPSTRAELVAAEAEVDAARAALVEMHRQQPAHVLPRAREEWEAAARALTTASERHQVRAALSYTLGDSAELRYENGAAFVFAAPSSLMMVAGARSVLYLTEPVRIPIPSGPDRNRRGD
jgi:DNA invertase Pin-like site-specific DNA recombinase